MMFVYPTNLEHWYEYNVSLSLGISEIREY